MDNKKILKFIFELGMLKKIKHEGWRVAGVSNLESVADHSLRAAQLAYVLAKMERYKDPKEVCTMLVFHDIGECRVGDIHKLANRYISVDEEGAVKDQLENLGKKISDEILSFWKQFEYKSTEAGIIAKDADLLEQAITAKEYLELGYKTENWIDNVETLIQTKSAKDLIKILRKETAFDWFLKLKKIK